MINWLMEQSLLLSVLTLLLITLGKSSHKFIGAKGLYKLWGIIPLSLGLSLLPDLKALPTESYKWVVTLSHNSQQIAADFEQYSLMPLIIWFAGILFLTIYYLQLHRHYLKELQLKPSTKRLQLNDEFQLRLQKLRIYRSKATSTPFITGLLRPYLVLPMEFERTFSQQQQQLILQHELTHKKHGDLYWNALAQLLLLIFWFNPLVWFGVRYFRQAQELACDQAVLEQEDKSTRIAYANAMLLCTGQPITVKNILLTYGDKADMKARLTQLKTHKQQKAWKWLFLALVSSVVITQVQAGLTHKANSDSATPVMRIEPIYPKQAAKEGIEGSVVLQFDIEKDGSTSNIKVVEAQPKGVFAESAIEAMKQWRWTETSRKSKDMLIQLDFVLDKKGLKPRLEAAKGDNEQIIVSN